MTDFHAFPLSTLEVHLDAVARNWLFLKKRLKAGADCAAVVKADAYGLGAGQVAPALYDQGCRHFFVAHVDEGFAVRQVLPSSDAVIYVLNGPHGASAADFINARLFPVLNTLGDIAYWKERGQRSGAVLHIDTGMNRFGLNPDEVQKADIAGLDLRCVMSHLACGDEKDHPKNREQLGLFQELTASLEKPFRLSFANSAGILLGPDYHFDLIRPGCALYGINPQEGLQNPMQGAITLKSKIIQIRKIAKPGTAGYGASYSVIPPALIATISVGYADGYLRSLTGRGQVAIGGEKCRIIGRVSMDSIIVDVTHLKAPPVEGDYAELVGKHLPVDDVAAAAGTIGYEILTDLGKRYKRTYTGV